LGGIAPVCFDPVSGFFGDERRGDYPAGESLFGKVAIEPVPAGAGLINEDELAGFALELADQLIDVVLTGVDRSEKDDLGTGSTGYITDGDEFLVDIQIDKVE